MSHTVYRFDDYILDASARVLLHCGEPVGVAPKSFDCLAYLIEQRERAVGRDELISAVWGRVEVSDAVLAQTLRRARIAVGDSGAEQSCIRTVPRFGYHWVSSVELVDSAAPGDDAQRTSEDGEPDLPVAPAEKIGPAVQRQDRRHVLWVILALLSVALFGGWLLVRVPGQHAAGPVTDSRSLVAVMPVEVTDEAGADNAWVRLGIMDFIAGRLRAGGKLNVMPSSQMVTLASAASRPGVPDAATVKRRSGARWVVQTSAGLRNGRWRVHLEVVGEPGFAPVDAEGSSVLDAANSASARLLQAMGADGDKPPHVDATSPLAERMQRIDAAMLGGQLDLAEQLIRQTPSRQREDPRLRMRAGRLAFRQGRIDRAEQIYAQLLAQEPAVSAEVQAASAMGVGAVAVRRGQFDAARRHYDRALELLGSHGDANLVGLAYTGRGVAYGAQGDYEHADDDLGRARIYLQRAGNAEDAASVDVNLGLLARRRQRYSQAIGHFDRAAEIFRRDQVRDNLAAALLGKTQAQLALVDLEGARRSSGQAWALAAGLANPILVSRLGLARTRVLLRSGSLSEADAVLAKVQPVAADRPLAILLKARLAQAWGDAQRAARVLQPLINGRDGPLFEALPDWVVASAQSEQAVAEDAPWLALEIDSLSGSQDRIALLLARALWEQTHQKNEKAARQFGQAMDLAHRSGTPSDVVRVGTAQAWFLLDQGKLDQATAIVGELTPYAERDFAVAQLTAALYRKLGETRLADAAAKRARQLAGERNPDRRALDQGGL